MNIFIFYSQRAKEDKKGFFTVHCKYSVNIFDEIAFRMGRIFHFVTFFLALSDFSPFTIFFYFLVVFVVPLP